MTRTTILQARSLNAALQADVEVLTEAATEGVRLSRQTGDLYALHMMLLNLGSAAILTGDLEPARPSFEEALRIAYQVDDRIGQFYLLAAIAHLASASGQARVAAQLLGASDEIRTGAGATVMAALAPFVAMAEDSATEKLGASRFRAEFDAGRRMPREAAVQLALGEKPGAQKESREDGALGNRETDVAHLVAEGMSNKQIAARLFISERTVDSHVRSILNKLGFSSRTQIAAWVSSNVASPAQRVDPRPRH